MGGRPRNEELDQVILDTTFELLKHKKVSELSVEAIATKAGVGKNTVYRRWSCKAAIVVDTLLAKVNSESIFPDTGSVYEDLRQQMLGLVKALDGSLGPLMKAVIAECQSEPQVFETFRHRFVELRRTETKEVLRRGISRGQLSADTDLDLLMDTLYGPIYFRLLVSQAPLTQNFVGELLEFVLKDKFKFF